MAQHGLGRGLGALLENPLEEVENRGNIQKAAIKNIEPNPNQPRRQFDEVALQELADSIAKHGLIQPIAVRRLVGGNYQIIAGERRWRACRRAGLTEVPIVILEASDLEVMELALIENLQREDLNPIEEAQGYKSLIEDFNLTQEQAAEKVGKSRSALTNSMRLLALPEEVQKMVKDGELSSGHARAILAIEGDENRRNTAKKALEQSLSVRQTEQLAKKISQEKQSKKPKVITVNYAEALERELSNAIGRKVKITDGRKRGKLEIEYYGNEDLETLCEALKKIAKK